MSNLITQLKQQKRRCDRSGAFAMGKLFQSAIDEIEGLRERADSVERERDEYEDALLEEAYGDIVTQDEHWYGCIHCHSEFISDGHEDACIIKQIQDRQKQRAEGESKQLEGE